jgi:hypothetical protein
MQFRLVLSFQKEEAKSSISSHDEAATVADSRYKLPNKKRRRAAVGPSPRIINGVETEQSRHPYVALLTAEHVLKCGGSVSLQFYFQVTVSFIHFSPEILLLAVDCSRHTLDCSSLYRKLF